MKKPICIIAPPGTKSIANRALILAALANGTSTLRNMPEGEDVHLMMQALKTLGIRIEKRKNEVRVHGRGGKFQLESSNFFVGNAGTVARFITPLLTLTGKKVIVTGDENMKKRPIQALTQALKNLGTTINYNEKNGFLPITIGPEKIQGGFTKIDASLSSQYLSGILMMGSQTQKPITLEIEKSISSAPYITMTLDLIKKFGGKITEKRKTRQYIITPSAYKSQNLTIETDAVAGSYIAGLAAVHKVNILIRGISPRTIQGEYSFFKVLKKMGKTLKSPGKVDCNAFPDSSMTLAILAAISHGKTTLTNIHHLRAKETDRIAALENELRKIGIHVSSTDDSLTIIGNPKLSLNKKILINTYHDHRMAMCFSILKSLFPCIEIENPACVKKSYPNFWNDYKTVITSLGKNIVLTGMRGSGKTTIGKALAQKSKMKFVDLDEVFEKKFKSSIASFVEKNGWKKFRQEEKKIVQKIGAKKNLVIATGGGTIIDKDNEKMLKKNGIAVFLDCPVEILKKRIQKDQKTASRRPHLQDIKTLYDERKNRYDASADLTIDSRHEDEKTIIEKLFPSF